MIKAFASCLRLLGFGVLMLGLDPSIVHAQVATAEQRSACTPDAFRLCSGEIPNIPAITACMRQNRSQLSPACKAVFPK
ncbi:signal peptide protein [Afipia sp. P52-10]|nr:signal peptide protein [Afipia sp. P52-10]